MAEIVAVAPDSLSADIGLKAGDEIITIDGDNIRDYIDFQYKTAENFFVLGVKKQNGEFKKIEVERNFGEKLGLEFDNIIFDQLKSCNNDCIFCFLKQSPSGLRSSLKKQDDDYRFSFLQGSFITLTNLSEKEFERIIRLHLSPLNISVHTTNPHLREKMMNNPIAARIIEQLKRLDETGISFNTQVVLCPGINDGDELNRTIRELSTLYPSLNSIGIVPVGLTKFREGRYPLQSYTSEKAKQVLKQINLWQKKLKGKYDENYLYAADEFYFLANKEIPEFEDYNDFPQIENGIGLTRLFWSGFTELKSSISSLNVKKRKIGIVTGELGKKALMPVIQEFNRMKKVFIKVIPVENNFFGPRVTVTGLLTGQDILTTIKKIDTFSNIILPGVAVNDKGYFLDDMNIVDLKSCLPDKNIYLANNLPEVLEVVKNE